VLSHWAPAGFEKVTNDSLTSGVFNGRLGTGLFLLQMATWITDRRPTQEDGDLQGMVLWGKQAGLLMHWDGVRHGEAWAHTSAWSSNPCHPSINELMLEMPVAWRRRWCNSQTCACMGCANVSGGLAAKGYTREEHQQWLQFNRTN
jgi:hypothetical protein